MVKIALSGAAGRMCRTIYKSLIGSKTFEIVYGIDTFIPDDLPFPVYSNTKDIKEKADVIIDFSRANSLDDLLTFAVSSNTKLVIATTGHTDAQIKAIEEASKKVAIFKASNMSLGVNLLSNLAKEAAKFLGEDFDVEIIEMHHNQKLDAPSGTAMTLAEDINSVRDNPLVPQFGRHETAHKREKNEIGIHAVRGGSIVGKHDVMFIGKGETVTLSHESASKEVFSEGALRAALYIMDKANGLYDMHSILGNFYAVTSVTADKDISFIELPYVTADKFLALLQHIKDANISLDMISQNVNPNGTLTIGFSLADADLPTVRNMISKGTDYTAISGCVKLNTEGAGMEHKSGVALEVLSILHNLGATVYAITTSETKISSCINADVLDKAVVELKKYYGI